ncbi:hypothetical protein CPB84DRAFT_1401518 [Gymnopilus junonius]|uniref:Uncharacterized protein n=1 Tax=Gymnopilus junonius TaxID=109634 RepID=A0A9P5NK57_GYMJU|nr:hypothetical protein CPB84DRAFT_1401518 [Gymnopilus junonius]
MYHQPEKNPEPQSVQDIVDLSSVRSLYDAATLRLHIRILIIADCTDGIHCITVPKPSSYEAAFLVLFHVLGRHIYVSSGTTLQGPHYAHRMSTSSHSLDWSPLLPEFWDEVVQNGDLIMGREGGAKWTLTWAGRTGRLRISTKPSPSFSKLTCSTSNSRASSVDCLFPPRPLFHWLPCIDRHQWQVLLLCLLLLLFPFRVWG